MSDLLIPREIVSPLVAWYRSVRRPLPWRENKDPYRIWLSEIMLQQTRIEAVIPYYHRFLAEAPTVEALADLSDDRLMKLWEGLGYYSRARNLKTAALTIVGEYGGSFPADFSALRRLKGVGDYTAGAIASIAFGLPEPAVDGNVLRVVMRLMGCEADVAAQSTKRSVTDALRKIYPIGEQASDLTEGLMELGEKLCLPAGTPVCSQCPLRDLCIARREGRQEELPKKSPKKEKRIEEHTVLLLICNKRIAIRKRTEPGLLSGLWEFPNRVGFLHEAEADEAVRTLNPSAQSPLPSVEAKHIFTHIVWNMKGFSAICAQTSEDLVWVTAEELATEYSLPTAFRAYKKEALRLLSDETDLEQ